MLCPTCVRQKCNHCKKRCCVEHHHKCDQCMGCCTQCLICCDTCGYFCSDSVKCHYSYESDEHCQSCPSCDPAKYEGKSNSQLYCSKHATPDFCEAKTAL
jgi:hypothetical protein